MTWRWDRGRLRYFQYSTVEAAAKVFHGLGRVALNAGNDPIKPKLKAATGLKFPPSKKGYPIWRNYARIFGVELLGVDIGNRLATTEICAQIATGQVGKDDYYRAFIRRFYYPFPAFEDYNPSAPQIFPLCAVLKLLIARARSGSDPVATPEDVVQLLVANQVSGEEPTMSYLSLPRRRVRNKNVEREVRELMKVASQASFLRWDQKAKQLSIDAGREDAGLLAGLEAIATPEKVPRLDDPAQEILQVGRAIQANGPLPAPEAAEDFEFTEGKEVRKAHLHRERNRALVKAFFATLSPPYKCNMCGAHVNSRYPWLNNLLEAHHVLPLSSPLRTGTKGTRISDLVPICPNCHRAVHAYYRAWFRRNSLDDFRSPAESKAVYGEAKSKFRQDA